MKNYSTKHLKFLLYEVLNVQELTQYAYFSMHGKDTFDMVLEIAEEISNKVMASAYADSDRKPAHFENGKITVHPAVKEFIKVYTEAGLLSATFPFEWEGQQLPKSVFAATEYINFSCHNSFMMFTDLINGCANLIYTFGTEEQKQTYLPNMLAAKWLGTMCLTEPQAGSSLSDISTMAYPQEDGTYKIVGQKIFISAGDHDVSDNIINLVLAKIVGSPEGAKGISLFIVPKYNSNGSLNDVSTIGMYHKMGQKATPAAHLSFGANNACTGYLLGEANKGLLQMFQMMNGARLGVGITGISIASAAYHTSLQYANERIQGRDLINNQPVTIINHPDVKRMLLSQKAIYEGGLALLLQNYLYLDLLKVDNENREKYHLLLELLTPVCKTYGAEMGIYAVNQGLQVLGGYGYTEDFPLEQMARDVRIMSIYEGTTGIQSQALLGRQVPLKNGISMVFLKEEIDKTIQEAEQIESIKNELNRFKDCWQRLEKITQHLLKIAQTGNIENYLADATHYMEFFGITCVAWQWLKMGAVAAKALENSTENQEFYASKLHTMKYFYKYEIAKLTTLESVLLDDEYLTNSQVVIGE